MKLDRDLVPPPWPKLYYWQPKGGSNEKHFTQVFTSYQYRHLSHLHTQGTSAVPWLNVILFRAYISNKFLQENPTIVIFPWVSWQTLVFSSSTFSCDILSKSFHGMNLTIRRSVWMVWGWIYVYMIKQSPQPTVAIDLPDACWVPNDSSPAKIPLYAHLRVQRYDAKCSASTLWQRVAVRVIGTEVRF